MSGLEHTRSTTNKFYDKVEEGVVRPALQSSTFYLHNPRKGLGPLGPLQGTLVLPLSKKSHFIFRGRRGPVSRWRIYTGRKRSFCAYGTLTVHKTCTAHNIPEKHTHMTCSGHEGPA